MQLGIILFPICIYQIYAFSRNTLQGPYHPWIMGLYGGITGILCQEMPVHIFGLPENYQCVPIILSILYGKRRAGLISISILSTYQLFSVSDPVGSIIAILIYSTLPMLVCYRFDRYNERTRFLLANLLSALTIVILLLFLVVYFFVKMGMDGLSELAGYIDYLTVAVITQLTIMAIAFFLLENMFKLDRIRRRHDSLILHNPLGISAFDMNNRFVGVNPAYERITGYSQSELLGQSRLIMYPTVDHHQAEELLDFLLKGEIKKDIELELRHKHGHQIPVRVTVVPMYEGKSMVGYFAMVEDVSESRTAEAALRNSEKLSAIGQLAAGVAHEIRNPLTAVKGFLQLLEGSAQPAHVKYYEVIRSEMSRIEGIVSEMLVLAKPNVASFSTVCLKKKLSEVVNLLSAEANMQGVEIVTEYEEGSTLVHAEGSQLKQVFLNLVKNAMEAMPAGGTITLKLQENDGLQVQVIDNGTGIPEDAIAKIGEPFYSTKSTGTGLGFLVSKRIIANHNGTLNIASTVGEGTTVTVTLPSATS